MGFELKNVNKWFIILLVFLFSASLRFFNLNQMGRTWDEPEYIEQGYKMIELIRARDFGNSYFYTTYDHPPLVKYLYGIASHFDTGYDYTFARVLSALVSSLSIILVVIIGWQFVSRFVGIASGIILAMLPFFLGLSQLVTAESFIMLSFTACIYSYILLFKKYSVKKVILAGILTGLALQIKQSNLLLIPIFFLMYLVWYLKGRQEKKIKFFNPKLNSIFYIAVISVFVFVVIWPQLIFSFKEVYAIHKELWHVTFSSKIWQITLSPPEVFFGRLMLTPVFYYLVYFLITTPMLIIVLFVAGLKRLNKLGDNKNNAWILYSFIIWFLFPFILSFYSWRQHGVRYIIEIYAPLSLIAAIGFDFTISKFAKKQIFKFVGLVCLMVYMFFILSKSTPYYLDYFNILVGGTNNVYQKRMFQLGWWGQGLREAGEYLTQNARVGTRVGLAVSPIHSVPPLPGMKVKKYNKRELYDYVIVNYYNILREGFDDSEIKRKYSSAYHVNADGAILVTVYKRK